MLLNKTHKQKSAKFSKTKKFQRFYFLANLLWLPGKCDKKTNKYSLCLLIYLSRKCRKRKKLINKHISSRQRTVWLLYTLTILWMTEIQSHWDDIHYGVYCITLVNKKSFLFWIISTKYEQRMNGSFENSFLFKNWQNLVEKDLCFIRNVCGNVQKFFNYILMTLKKRLRI